MYLSIYFVGRMQNCVLYWDCDWDWIGLVIGFIDFLHFVTTINSRAVVISHNLQYTTARI
jgi:hypothetical protein